MIGGRMRYVMQLDVADLAATRFTRSEEHTSELQSLV